ncbi:MAG: hypothetical protein Q9216_003799 [Gyalolechia sp. 2 TL-2023]
MAGEEAYSALPAQSGDESDQIEQGKAGTASTYSKAFNPREQLWQLLAEQMPRLIFTAVLIAVTLIIVKVYEQKSPVSLDDKHVFNTIVTVVNLALALNFLEAFKDMAKVLRWRVLANRKFTVRETDLILGGESLLKLATLALGSLKKPLTVFVCAFWILLNILAQASVAIITLNYSMETGVNSTGVTTSRGNVSFAKIDCYYNSGNCTTAPDQPPEVAQNEAHAYGEASLRERRCPYETDDDIFKSREDCTYFTRGDSQEYAYRYMEYNPDDRARAYPHPTERLIKTSTGQCSQYKPNASHPVGSPDGPASILVFPYSDGREDTALRIARTDSAFDSTTYAFTGIHPPQAASASTVVCGPRCIWVYAIRHHGPVTERDDEIFKCPITVSNVSNVDDMAHVVPHNTARLAAASIALSGRYTNPDSDEKEWQQYQWYPYGSYWELGDLSAQEVGSRMAEFAIGSLTSMANYNPQQNVSGTLPTLGYSLSVHWSYMIALAAVITGVHCLLVGLILWIARPVVVPGDSNLVVARLLHGLVGRLGEKGNLLEAKEIAEAIEKGEKEHEDANAVQKERGTVGYGVRHESSGAVLEIGEGLKRRKSLPGGKFPQGGYA